MKDFSMDMIEIISQTGETLVVRTAYLLPTLMFMQNAGWKLSELIPDDTNGQEFNILSFVKHTDEKN